MCVYITYVVLQVITYLCVHYTCVARSVLSESCEALQVSIYMCIAHSSKLIGVDDAFAYDVCTLIYKRLAYDAFAYDAFAYHVPTRIHIKIYI